MNENSRIKKLHLKIANTDRLINKITQSKHKDKTAIPNALYKSLSISSNKDNSLEEASNKLLNDSQKNHLRKSTMYC